MRIASIGAVIVACALAAVTARPADAQIRPNATQSAALFAHITKGETKEAQVLIEKDAGLLNAQDAYGMQPLGAAVKANQPDLVRFCLGKGADINYQDGDKNTPLIQAVKQKSREMALILIDGKANLDLRNRRVKTALVYACEWGDADVIAALKKAGAKLTAGDAVSVKDYDALAALLNEKAETANAADDVGRTPLYMAVVGKDPKAAATLLEKGADPNGKCGKFGTPMVLATQMGNKEMQLLLAGKGGKVGSAADLSFTLLDTAGRKNAALMKELLDKGADVNSKNEQGDTPLYKAAYFGDLEAVKLLLAHKADIQSRNRQEATPLMAAAASGQIEIIKLLVQNGADVNSKTSWGETAIFGAIQSGRIGAVKALIDLKADVNVLSKGTISTPLFAAMKWDPGEKELQIAQIAKLLLDAGADPTVRNDSNQTPLQVAIGMKNKKLVALLTDAKPPAGSPAAVNPGETLLAGIRVRDLDATKKLLTERGKDIPAAKLNEALCLALAQNQAEVMGWILGAGADVNTRVDDVGNTPLISAAGYGRKDIVVLLLSKGAQVNLANNMARTALWSAQTADIREILIKAGGTTQPDAGVTPKNP